MPLVVEIDADSLEGMALKLDLAKRDMEAAARAAVNRTVRWARMQVARGMAARLGIGQGVIGKRVKARGAKGRNTRGQVWVGLDPLNVASAKPRKTPRGLRAGRQDFPGAFIGKGRYGGQVAYRRAGKARYPLEAVAFDLKSLAPELIDRGAWPELNAKFLEFYQAELERRVGR